MPNQIILTNTLALFDGPAKHQASQLLSFRQKGYQFTRAYKRGGWNGQVKIMRRDGRFPAGLASWLIQQLQSQGIQTEIDDQRPPLLPLCPELASLVGNIELRPHQLDAVEAAYQAERGVIHHPTGAGKTEVMIELARQIGRKGLVLTHRKDLLNQTVERAIQRLGLGRTLKDFDKQDVVGIIGDGHWRPKLLTVATFQTLYLRLKERDERVTRWLREEIAQVHVDEVHHLSAKSYEMVMACLVNARYRFGFSATPWKDGDLETFFKVASYLGSTVHQVTSEELTEQNLLVPADVFMLRIPTPQVNYRNWPEAVRYGLVENAVRNNMIADLARRLDESKTGPVVILVERLAHGEILAQMLSTDFVAGNAPTVSRQRAWNALREGRQNLLITSKIADEGLDLPPLCYILMAGGGKAPHLTLQRIGRGMRLSLGKDRLFVIDFFDQGKYLHKHAKTRLATYQSQPSYSVTECEFEEVCPS